MVSDHQAFANRGVDPQLFPLQSRLRRLGTEFLRAYTVLPICSPTRASMLTGLYPHAHGLTENDGRFGGRAELDAADSVIQKDFADAGYRCGWFGKWHLNHETSATDHGFEGFSLPGYGYPYCTQEYSNYLARFHEGPLWAEIESSGKSRRAPGDRVDLIAETGWYEYEAGTAIIHGPEQAHEAFFLADAATNWLDGLADDEPLFLRVDTWGPHPPYTIPTGFEAPFDDSEIRLAENLNHDLSTRPQHHADYRDKWREDLREDAFDWALLAQRALEHCILVERALAGLLYHLEAAGKLENTIIVFCSDHGDAVASNGGVMNKGSLMVEETMRIPMLIAGPGIAAGRQSDSLICNLDLAPTLLELAGVDARHVMQGRSAAGELQGATHKPIRERLMVEQYGLHVPILQRGLYWKDLKYVIQADGFEELYDLSTDPFEMKTWMLDHPPPQDLADMRRHLREEMAELNDNDPRLERIRQVLHGAALN